MNGIPTLKYPIQTVSLTFADGSVMTATVDLWLASLLEVVDEETREAWIAKAQEHLAAIQAKQVQPVPQIIMPGQG